MKKLFLIALTAIAVAGCVAPRKTVAVKTKFDPSEYTAYLAKGSTKVTGQAFLRQQGGGTVTCAGARAVLLPATGYFRESTDFLVKGEMVDNKDNKPGPAFSGLLRETRCDAQGNFEFENVPAGRYIVMSEVSWVIASSRQGGLVRREVNVVEGGSNRFLLSDADR